MNISLLVLLSCPSSFVLLVLLARVLLFLVSVEGESMYPALEDGDRVLAMRYWPNWWLRKGQIVIARFGATEGHSDRHPQSTSENRFIKLVVGLPGDRVVAHISEFPEPLRSRQRSLYDEQGRRTWHIPPGHCFVRGDSFGVDSSVVGPIPFHALRGVVLMKLRGRGGISHPRTVSADRSERTEAIEES